MSEKMRDELKALQDEIARHKLGLDKLSQDIRNLKGRSEKNWRQLRPGQSRRFPKR